MEVLSDLIKDSVSAFAPGGGGGSGLPLYIQDTQPVDSGNYIWVQTNIGGDPLAISVWVNK